MRCGIKILSLAILFSVFNARAESSTSFTCGVSYTTRADVESAIDACNRELNSSSTSATRKRGVEDNIKEYNHQLDDIAKREEATSASEKAKKAQKKLSIESGIYSIGAGIIGLGAWTTCNTWWNNPAGASAACSKSVGALTTIPTKSTGILYKSPDSKTSQSACSNPPLACGLMVAGTAALGIQAIRKGKEAASMGDICNLLSDGHCDPGDDPPPIKTPPPTTPPPGSEILPPPTNYAGATTEVCSDPACVLNCAKSDCSDKCKIDKASCAINLNKDGSVTMTKDSNGDGKFNKLVASVSPKDVSRLLASDGFQKQVRAKFEKDNPDLVDELAAALGEKTDSSSDSSVSKFAGSKTSTRYPGKKAKKSKNKSRGGADPFATKMQDMLASLNQNKQGGVDSAVAGKTVVVDGIVAGVAVDNIFEMTSRQYKQHSKNKEFVGQ